MGENKVVASWSGRYPNLCFGEWHLSVNGKDVTDLIPEDLRDASMGTRGTYSRWHFDANWIEVFEDYDDGLEEEKWIEENLEWLSKISLDPDVQSKIYYALQSEDFRSGSCGGCI